MSSASRAGEPLTADRVVRMAQGEVEAFRARVRDVPYESKGILYSEMFFLYLCARTARPRRILESGRARGQSTLLLAKAFPGLPIVSIEHDRTSPDVPVAEIRLRGYRNVDLQFGDATQLLPRTAEPGDVVLIDGPKGFRALRLALRLLAQGRVSMVFVHDMLQGTRERRFLQAHVPDALYSDDANFVAIAHALDAPAAADIPAERRWTADGAPAGYGYGLACLPFSPAASYAKARCAAALAGLAARLAS